MDGGRDVVNVNLYLDESRGHCSELRSCVKVEVAVLIVFMVSVDVKQHRTGFRAQELCESRGGHPNSPYGFCGRKATLNRLQSSGAV